MGEPLRESHTRPRTVLVLQTLTTLGATRLTMGAKLVMSAGTRTGFDSSTTPGAALPCPSGARLSQPAATLRISAARRLRAAAENTACPPRPRKAPWPKSDLIQFTMGGKKRKTTRLFAGS
jgi:hypothetical protein